MNLAVHGLSGDIREANTYYEDPHEAASARFDFVMANPPFNVSGVDKDRLKDDAALPAWACRAPTTPTTSGSSSSASSLNENGRAGFVMANSAGDARGSELEIRKKLIQSGAVDVIVSDRLRTSSTPSRCRARCGSSTGPRRTGRARTRCCSWTPALFRQIDRAHRDFTPEQIEFLANIVRLYRGEDAGVRRGQQSCWHEHFANKALRRRAGPVQGRDAGGDRGAGLEPEPRPLRRCGGAAVDEFDFAERLEELNEELQRLGHEAQLLETEISGNVDSMLSRALN